MKRLRIPNRSKTKTPESAPTTDESQEGADTEADQTSGSAATNFPPTLRQSSAPKTSLVDRQLLVTSAASILVTVIALLVSLRLRQLSDRFTGVLSDGKHFFAPGEVLGDQASAGMFVSVLSLVSIVAAYVFRRYLKYTGVYVVVMTVISLAIVVFAFASWQQYRGLAGL